MAIKKPNISQIREFTKRDSFKTWLPSLDSKSAFEKTFTIPTPNVIPQTGQQIGGATAGTGEINILTDFKSAGSTDLNRYTLFLYCLRNEPYFFEKVLDALFFEDDKQFTQSLQDFLTGYQTGVQDTEFSKSLTTEIVRVYRGTKIKDVEDDKSIQKILEYAKTPNSDFQRNVTGVLGKVTYDSTIKHTLYRLLLKNNIIQDYSKPAGTWAEISNQLNIDEYKLYVDPSGGPYKRAFPVICVLAKKEKGKKVSDLIEESNKLVESKFFRKLKGTEQLVTELKSGNEKNFVENPLSQTNYSTYYIIYDFAKVITLPPNTDKDYTLSLLKIGLSILSRKNNLTFYTISEFEKFYQEVRSYILNSLNENYEEFNFEIALKNKHTKECEYILDKNNASLKSKISKPFKLQVELLFYSIESVYKKIVETFKSQILPGAKQNFQFKEYPTEIDPAITLHFDNFYNLLAVTSVNKSPTKKIKEIDLTSPFVLEDYETTFSSDDLVVQFFKNQNTLPTFANGEYKFAKQIALENDIVFVTEAFLKELYYNLDPGKNFVYENDKNQNNDDVLTEKSFEILKLIAERTTEKNLKKEDYFFFSSNNIFLRKEVVRKLELSELNFTFDSVKEDKIKFQTISHFLYAPRKKKATLDYFINNVYYPKLIQTTSPIPEDEQPVPPTPVPQKKPPKDNNYLINNIITSELACYEDISNSFDQALNVEETTDKLIAIGKTLINIGLPFLLAYASQKIAAKLSRISKDKVDPSLLDCVLQDSENLKKFVIGALDISTSDNPKQLLLQYAPQLPQIPQIPYFPIFDLEKELKRRIIEFIIDQIIKLLKEQLDYALQPVIDMCNSDSYLTAFLNNSFPNKNTSENKLSSPNAAGLPSDSIPTTYIPNITVDINTLIDQSQVETRENVYEYFRVNFFVTKEEYPDLEISNFFDYISDKVDAGEMVSLLKGSSNLQTRKTLLAYIKTYGQKFDIIINDQESVAFLFIFLARYVDYKLILQFISQSLTNFTPTVCVDIESRFDELSSNFTQEQLEDQANDLENALANACSLKKPLSINLIAGGPSLLTKNLSDSLNTTFKSIVDGTERSLESNNKQIGTDTSFKLIYDSIPNIKLFTKTTTIRELVFSIFQYAGETKEQKAFIQDTLKALTEDSNIALEKYKKIFVQNLTNSGNLALNTNQAIFSGYINKFKSLEKEIIYEEKFSQNKQQVSKELSLQDFNLDNSTYPYFDYEKAVSSNPFGINFGSFNFPEGTPEKYKNLYLKLEQLYFAVKGLGTDKDTIKTTIKNMTNEEKCWMCTRRVALVSKEDKKLKSSMMYVIEQDLDSEDANDYLYKPLGNGSSDGCKVWGYATKEGGESDGVMLCSDLINSKLF